MCVMSSPFVYRPAKSACARKICSSTSERNVRTNTYSNMSRMFFWSSSTIVVKNTRDIA